MTILKCPICNGDEVRVFVDLHLGFKLNQDQWTICTHIGPDNFKINSEFATCMDCLSEVKLTSEQWAHFYKSLN